MFVIIGALIVLGSVIGGYLMEGGQILVLNQPAEFLIIAGASAGSLLIGTPFRVLSLMARQTKTFFTKATSRNDYLELLTMQYQLFKVIQQSGVMALESHFEKPEESPILSRFPGFLARHHAVDFLADSVKVIIMGGIAAHDLESLMDEDMEVHHDEAVKPSMTLGKIADALPGLGIVAAVLGVVITMGSIDGPPAEIGEKVGAALVGTFLGILLSYGFVQPLSINLEHMVSDEARYVLCIKTGLLAAQKGFAPAIAVEFARRVLSSDVRPRFDETENVCKAVKAEAMAA